MSVPDDLPYPGQRFGMPRAGSGAMATFGPRVGAVVVDWLLCQLLAYGLFQVPWGATGTQSFVPLGLFAAENLLLVSTTGSTIGHRLFGLQVGQIRGGWFPLQVAIRTALLCLFLPAVVSDRDGRGWHDRAAGTVIVKR